MDNLKRKIDYLRISITDRCNLRCIYCMPPGGIINKPQVEMLTFEEIIRLVRIFTSLGISKIRLTGGEPLVRREIVNLVKSLVSIEGIEEVSLTTNGTLLSLYTRQLKKAGIKRINISLDTLKGERFKKITGSDCFYRVLEGIKRAKEIGFDCIKLNMVVMKGINDDEIIDFIEFALSNGLTSRFIEFMKVTPLWREDYFIPIENVKRICERRFMLRKLEESQGPGPAEYYKVKSGIVGFIKTDEYNCQCCTRLRLTSTGELKICLFEPRGLCLRALLRNGIIDEEVENIIRARVEFKKDIDYIYWETSQLYMCKVGG